MYIRTQCKRPPGNILTRTGRQIRTDRLWLPACLPACLYTLSYRSPLQSLEFRVSFGPFYSVILIDRCRSIVIQFQQYCGQKCVISGIAVARHSKAAEQNEQRLSWFVSGRSRVCGYHEGYYNTTTRIAAVQQCANIYGVCAFCANYQYKHTIYIFVIYSNCFGAKQ